MWDIVGALIIFFWIIPACLAIGFFILWGIGRALPYILAIAGVVFGVPVFLFAIKNLTDWLAVEFPGSSDLIDAWFPAGFTVMIVATVMTILHARKKANSRGTGDKAGT